MRHIFNIDDGDVDDDGSSGSDDDDDGDDDDDDDDKLYQAHFQTKPHVHSTTAIMIISNEFSRDILSGSLVNLVVIKLHVWETLDMHGF